MTMKDSSSKTFVGSFNSVMSLKRYLRRLRSYLSTLLVSIFILFLLSEPVLANDDYTIGPSRCVSLREGQPCFVKLRVTWKKESISHVCLYKEKDELLACWEGELGNAILPQSITSDTRYILKNKLGDELSSVEVKVSWVYRKKRSRRRWRLF